MRFSGQFGGEWVDLGRQQLGALAGLTVSAWVKLSEPRFGTVFSGGFTIGSGAPTRGIPESERPGAEAFAGVVNFGGWSPKPDGRLDSHRRVDDGQWHHVAWIWSADGWRRIWIDGVEDVARQDAEQAGRRWDDWYWAIGADSDRLVWNFPGTIDEVRIYGRAVSAAELRRLAGVAAEIP